MRILPILTAILGLAAPMAHAGPRDWPQLEGGAGVPECQQALDIARGVFNSNVATFREPVPLPANLADARVLSRRELDISGGDGLVHDATVFDRYDAQYVIYFWQRDAHDGQRLVAADIPGGWRGDSYRYYLLPEAATRTDLSARTNDDYVLTAGDPPMVMRNSETGALWLIDMEQTQQLWPVRRVGADIATAAPLCSIRFYPEEADTTVFLPPEVRTFARLLPQTHGDGSDEGTLQSSARIRNRVALYWLNASYRPWATIPPPYNTREQVDTAMRRWARQAPSFNTVYQAIQTQYPRAQAALARHYRTNFGLSAEQADASAAYAMDVIYRSNYVFSGGSREPIPPNPWPEGVR